MKLQVIISIDTGDDPVWAVTDVSAAEMLAYLQEEYPSLPAFLVDVLNEPARWSVALVLELADDKALGPPSPPWSNDDQLMTSGIPEPPTNPLRLVE